MSKSQIKIGVTLSYIIIAVNTIGGFLITPFMLRELGQNNYGLYTLIASFSGYLTLMDFGVTTTTVRYISKYRVEKKFNKLESFIGSILSLYLLIGILIILIGSILYNNIGLIFSSSISPSQMYEARVMFVFVIINSSLTMLMHALPAIITAYEKFSFSKTLELARIILRLVLIYLFVNNGYSAISIVIIDTLLNCALALFRFIYINKVLKIKLRFRKVEASFIREVGQFSFFVFLSSVINQVNVRVDQLILGIVSTTDEIAISGIGSKLNQYYHQLAIALSGVFLPRITAMVSNKRSIEEIENFSIKVGKLQGKLLMLVITGFIAVGKQFIDLWVGSNFEIVYTIVLILMLSNLAAYTQGILLSLTQAMNKHATRNIIYIIITLLNVGMTIPLARSYGALGATVATGISMFIGYYIGIQIYYHKTIKINMFRFFFETIVKVIPSAVLSLIVVYVISPVIGEGILSFLIKIIVIITVYIGSLIIIDFTAFEKQLLRSFLIRITRKFRRRGDEN